MTIVILVNNMKNVGPCNVIRTLLPEIQKGNTIYLITLFNKNDTNIILNLKQLQIKHIDLNLNYKTFISRGSKELDKLLKKLKPDVIHSHGILPDILNAKSKTKVNKITTVHSNILEDYILAFGQVKGRILTAIHKHFLRKILVIACSKSVADSLKLKKVEYIRNGVNLEEYIFNQKISKNIKKELKIEESANIFVYAGSFTKRKRPLFLIEEFKKYRSELDYLLMLGSGPLYEECLKLQDNNVKILGFKSNIKEYLMASDVYISASLSEGYSISILEALALNNFLFLYDMPSHNEIVNIDSKYYIGELFSDINFEQKFKEIKSNIKKKTIEQKFKENYLSSKCASKEYLSYYRR